jgi:hypothetical protein
MQDSCQKARFREFFHLQNLRSDSTQLSTFYQHLMQKNNLAADLDYPATRHTHYYSAFMKAWRTIYVHNIHNPANAPPDV